MRFTYIIPIILALMLNVSLSEGQWKRVYRHYDYNMGLRQYNLSCADELNCFSSARGRLIRTTDGGFSWFVQIVDQVIEVYDDEGNLIDLIPKRFEDYKCIEFVTPEFAVAGHAKGQITITRDGGETWDSTYLNVNSQDIKDIQFVNENYGVVRTNWYFVKTYNAGEDWEYIDLKYKEELNTYELEMHVIGEDSIIVVVLERTDPEDIFYNRIVRTFDGGESWDIGTRIPMYSSWRPYFIDMNLGWVAGRYKEMDEMQPIHSDVICKTTDGGQTWEVQLDTLLYRQFGLFGIYFSDEKEGVAWTPAGRFWRTNDGGENWLIDTTYIEADIDNISDLCFPNGNMQKILANVWVFGEIWMYEDLTSVGKTKNEDIHGLVYPNPTDASLYIEKYEGIPLEYEIFDYAGKKVLTGTLRSHKIDVSALPAAAYIIVLDDKTDKHTMKFIKK